MKFSLMRRPRANQCAGRSKGFFSFLLVSLFIWAFPVAVAESPVFTAKVCQLTMSARFADGRQAVTNRKTPLWDDPVNASSELVTLKANTAVTVLWAYGQLCYVEAFAQNDVWSGFVNISYLE